MALIDAKEHPGILNLIESDFLVNQPNVPVELNLLATELE